MADNGKQQAIEWGRQAEHIVMEWLISKGYTVRETNWRSPTSRSEIDLIVQKDGMIAFVEVKARTDRKMDPAEAITPVKIRNVVRGANTYLRSLEHDYTYRFDVATISGTPDDYVLDYMEDAFLPPLFSR